MKKIVLGIFCLFIGEIIYAQVQKNIAGMHVTFPQEPEYTHNPYPIYMLNTEDINYIVQVLDMTDSDKLRQIRKTASKQEINKVERMFLDNMFKGIISTGSITPFSIKDFDLGNRIGKHLKGVQHLEQGEVDCEIRLMVNRPKVIFFGCQMMNDSPQAHYQKNNFFNSIR
ncbi:hypothetical protein ACIRNY_11770 [Capnocytophaga canimorsus]|uniref:hypothetical protein n=1 Tax=Capnocytophaga canimorsus TaxID=28188 RepID=UPI00384A7605